MSRAKLPDKLLAPSERDIERACSDLLKYDGWRAIVTDPPQLRGLGVSEKGIPDRLYIRYMYSTPAPNLVAAASPSDKARAQCVEVLWVEWKRPGGKASDHQKAWHVAERARGALVWCAGKDFPATVDGFLEHYRKSGLNRRPI